MRRAFFLLAALLLVCLPARAEGDVRAVVDALDLQGFEETVGETGIDAREMLISIASGEETWELSDVLARLRAEGFGGVWELGGAGEEMFVYRRFSDRKD